MQGQKDKEGLENCLGTRLALQPCELTINSSHILLTALLLMLVVVSGTER